MLEQFRTFYKDTVSWMLYRGCCIVDAVSWMLYRGCCIVDAVSWMLYRGCCIVDAVSWMLYRGCCIVDACHLLQTSVPFDEYTISLAAIVLAFC